MAKRLCGFCEGRGKITNEHVLGQWIAPLFGAGPGARQMQNEFTREDRPGVPSVDVAWRAYGFDQQVQMACKTCNRGWMSSLEGIVQPIITPMILGQRERLDLRAQVELATWAVKTAMVVEYLQKPHQRYFTQSERRALMTDAVPSHVPGAHVWVGRFGVQNAGSHGLAAGLVRADRLVAAHVSTFAIGQLAVQVFVERRTAGYVGNLTARPGPWDQLLIEIWPPSTLSALHGAALIWPPQLGMDRVGFIALFERFLDLSVQRSPYRLDRAP